MPTRRTYRRITAQDNSTTLPQRVTFPVGTFTLANTMLPYASNPATAAAGSLGAPSAMLPPRLSNVNTGNPRGGQPVAPVSFGAQSVPTTFGNAAQGMAQYAASERNTPPFGNVPPLTQQGMAQYMASEKTMTPIIPTGSFLSGSGAPNAQQASAAQTAFSNFVTSFQIPSSLSAGDIEYWKTQGLDASDLVAKGVLSYNASTDKYVITPLGMEANNAAQGQAAQPLGYGQYVNSEGGVSQGATPFKTNAQGQRLDASGNVWDPATATHDIYGGQFIQVGEVRWERVNGKLRRVRYGKGNTKTVIKGGARQGQTAAAPTSAVSSDGMAVSNAMLNVSVG